MIMSESPAFVFGLHSRSDLKVRPSPLLLGASGLTLFPFYQLVDFRSALMVSETSASENPGASKSVSGTANPHHVPAVLKRGPSKNERRQKRKLFDGQTHGE